MNKERRKDINQIIGELSMVKRRLGFILGDEQDSFDNMPEGLQSSINGENSEEAIDLLDAAIESLEETIDSLSEIN